MWARTDETWQLWAGTLHPRPQVSGLSSWVEQELWQGLRHLLLHMLWLRRRDGQEDRDVGNNIYGCGIEVPSRL